MHTEELWRCAEGSFWPFSRDWLAYVYEKAVQDWRKYQQTSIQHSGSPGSCTNKESACNAGDSGSIPRSGRSLEEGIGYPLQYSWASLVVQTVKNPSAMEMGSILGLGRSPGGGPGNPLQYSCQENPMDRAWRATVDGVTKSLTWLSNQEQHSALTKDQQ